jgi:hypothetical protein
MLHVIFFSKDVFIFEDEMTKVAVQDGAAYGNKFESSFNGDEDLDCT